MTDIDAAGGHWSDIQDAVNLASLGDWVRIPAGTHNFVNDQENITTVTIPAGINISGAPTERDGNGHVVSYNTTLQLPWDVPGTWDVAPLWFEVAGSYQEGETSRFTDIKFIGYRTIDSESVTVSKCIIIDDVRDFRVDHCYFENLAATCIATDGLYCRGLIDHCHFINTVGIVGTTLNECTVFYGVGFSRAEGDYWDDDISNVLGQYTNYTTFIENCVFTLWRHCTVANDGAHYVLRHCTIVDDWGYGSIDAHGWGRWEDPPGEVIKVGTRATEIYECSITNATNSVRGTMIRGGAGIAYNNTFGGGTYDRFILFSNEADSEVSKCWIHDWWVWNNTMLGGADEIKKYDPGGDIIEGVNYFRYEPHTFSYITYSYPHPLQGENGGDPKMEQATYDRLKARVSAIGRTRAQWSEEKLTSALLGMIDEILDALEP